MQLFSRDLVDGAGMPEEFCLGVADGAGHARFGDNLNPHMSWRGAPAGTRSFVLICHDPDAPSSAQDVNRDDREVSPDLRRVDFYHWVLFDIPLSVHEIETASMSSGITPGGKPGPEAGQGMKAGLNDYSRWFADDPQMAGKWFGYDGPFPPWNDSVIHHYVFTIYALDVDRLQYDGEPTGSNIRAAMAGHVLDRGSLIQTYTLNPRLTALHAAGYRPRPGVRVPGTMLGI